MMPWIIAGTPEGWISRPARISAPNRIDATIDPQRAEPGEVRDDDRGEAVARRDVVLQPVDHAADLAHARQAGERAGDANTTMIRAADVDAGVARGARVVADEPDLVAPARPLERRTRRSPAATSPNSKPRWTVRPPSAGHRAAKSVRRGSQASRGNWRGLLEAALAPRPEDPELDPGQRDVVEHQRGDDLVDAEARLAGRPGSGPTARPASGARQHHRRDHDEAGRAGRQQRRRARPRWRPTRPAGTGPRRRCSTAASGTRARRPGR